MGIVSNIKPDNKEEVYIALGSFDGLHRGHLELIKKCISLAKENNAKSMVFTFSNHPRTVILKGKKLKFLMENDEKVSILKKVGIDEVILKEFNDEFMKLSPEGFIEKLCENLNVKGIIVGFNYRFGYKNLGDINLLKTLSHKYGYEVYIINPLKYRDEVVSSTRIRNTLSNGNVVEAKEMLTRPYTLKGIVEHGRKIGRTIGFPTANIKIKDDILLPKVGVYYTNVLVCGNLYKGITSVGNNPTVNGQGLTVETFILDFDKNIYGDELKILFLDRIRDEKKFNSLDELVSRLKKDESYAKDKDFYNII